MTDILQVILEFHEWQLYANFLSILILHHGFNLHASPKKKNREIV